MILGYKVMQLLGPKSSWYTKVSKTQKNKYSKIKKREQFVPNITLRLIHKHAEERIKEKLPEFNIQFRSATAFVEKGGIDKHFARHVNKAGYFEQFWFVTDLKKAYQAVNTYALAQILCNLFLRDPNPYPKGSDDWVICEEFFKASKTPLQYKSEFTISDMKAYLEDYFVNPKIKTGLAEGFPLSPLLFNLYAEIMLDQQLRNLCERYQITYSRFADDLIFTSDVAIGRVKRRKIKDMIRSVFKINEEKTIFFDIDRYPQGVVLNKCVVRNRNGQAEISMLGKDKKTFKRLLYFAHKHEETAELSILAGNYGTFSLKSKFLGTTCPEPSRDYKQIVQLFKGYVKFINKGEVPDEL